jgi:hypothetical protein
VKKAPEYPTPSWDEALLGRLVAFVNIWKNFEGNEQAGAQMFLNSLLDIYDVRDSPETECPGWRRGARPARREEGAWPPM